MSRRDRRKHPRQPPLANTLPTRQESKPAATPPGAAAFLAELERHCLTTAFATVRFPPPPPGTGTPRPASWGAALDLTRELAGVGYSGDGKRDRAWLAAQIPHGGILILRSLTSEEDPETGLLVRELRGYRFWDDAGTLQWERLPPAHVSLVGMLTPAGNAVEPEPGVRFC